ncbi:MAG: TM2 domain-containing protein [Sphingomonadales bacterium]|nr:TM2 domain-containing protein [Sphingomonadales bacterium]
MQGSGFGRKGLSTGSGAAPRVAPTAARMAMPPRNDEMPPRDGLPPRNTEMPQSGLRARAFFEQDDAIAAKRQAFVAAERLRRDDDGQVLPGQRTAAPDRDYSATFGSEKPEKSLAVAYLLWFFFGGFSAHRLYLGAYASAGMQFGLIFFAFASSLIGGAMVGLGGFLVIIWCIWLFIDLFLIPGVRRKFCNTAIRYDLHEAYA